MPARKAFTVSPYGMLDPASAGKLVGSPLPDEDYPRLSRMDLIRAVSTSPAHYLGQGGLNKGAYHKFGQYFTVPSVHHAEALAEEFGLWVYHVPNPPSAIEGKGLVFFAEYRRGSGYNGEGPRLASKGKVRLDRFTDDGKGLEFFNPDGSKVKRKTASLTVSERLDMKRLAQSLPKGSPERLAIEVGLRRTFENE